MFHRFVRYLATYLLLAVAATFSFGDVAAQTSQPTGLVLEEIVVTATKRERSLQDIPVAVSAYSDTQLKYAGVQDIPRADGHRAKLVLVQLAI